MTQREVTRIVPSQPTSDGAGVRLNRSLGTPALPMVDPFLMLDEFRSDDPNDYIAGFPSHPHRGFETVTYMLAGDMEHKDSVGNSGRLTAGGAQWMTAGRGIVHSEMPKQKDGLMWGFQLWVNLPAKEKMKAPRYQDLSPDQIPIVEVDGATVRVIAGEVAGKRGPVDGVSVDPTMIDVTLKPGAKLTQALPEKHGAFLYVFGGAAIVGSDGVRVPRGAAAVLSEGDSIAIEGDEAEGARVLLLAAKPIKEPVARYGPFVMNTETEIRQAVRDFQTGRFTA
jgi:redox-sensitive bicupin YhaK (pirin superfamily)